MALEFNLHKQLKGHWTCDSQDISGSTLYDSTANDLPDATINGSVSTGLTGSPIGEHTESDGTDPSYIGTRYQLSSTLTNGFTVSAWIKDIGAGGDTAGGRFLSMDLSDWWGIQRNGSVGTVQIYMNQSDGVGLTVSDNNLGTGTWAHYVLVWDHTIPEMRVYKDGSLFATQASATTGFGTGTVARYLILHDGSESTAYNTNQNIPTDSGLSDVRVWERPITEDEISAIYQMRTQRSAYL